MLEFFHKYKFKYIILVFILYFAFYNLFVMYANQVEEGRYSTVSNTTAIEPITHEGKDYYFDNSLFSIQGSYKFDNKTKDSISLIPEEPEGNLSDRIINQMRYFHPMFKTAKNKIIFVEDDYPVNVDISMCPMKKCQFLFDLNQISKADLILLRSFNVNPEKFLPSQIIVPFVLESPLHFDFKFRPQLLNYFNWTANYRFDATIVTPYFKFTPYDFTDLNTKRFPYPKIDYSKNRKKHIIWFVSNCQTDNGRIELANLLGKHFQVDIYGACGTLRCPRTMESECLAMLKNYMFYLSFENSNCRHYITEKLFKNALNSSIVPIVFGAPPEDYKLVAPPHSYIHVEDFANLTMLVGYLKYLMENGTAYNEYFSWKAYGTVDTNTFFWCRLCTMVHYADLAKPSVASHAHEWWNKNHSCVRKSWNIQSYW